MQSSICVLSQGSVFEEASQLMKRLLDIDLSAKQFQRVSGHCGDQIDPMAEANHIDYMPQLPRPKDKDEYTYVIMDGCMLFAREEKWKENKLARIFHQSHNIDVQDNRNEIMNTVYVSHSGSVDRFLPKVERHLSLVCGRKVFIR